MILYHFTHKGALAEIAEFGLMLGEVPLSPTKTETGVWLTSDDNAEGHGLTFGGVLSDTEREAYQWMHPGRVIPKRATRPNKRAFRLTIDLTDCDRNLVHWPKWGRKRLDRKWHKTLSSTGGDNR